MLYVAQLLLPDTRELAAGEQPLVYHVYQLYAGGRGYEVLALAAYVVALEERLDDAGSRRRASDAVLLERGAQFLVVHKLACRLHGSQERGFGVWLGWRGLLLGKSRRVWTLFALDKGFERALFVVFLGLVVLMGVSGIDLTPSGGKNFLSRHLEVYLVYGSRHRGGGEGAVGVEGGDEAAHDEVVDIVLEVGESSRLLSGGNDGVVVGHLGGVEDTLGLDEGLPGYRSHQFVIALEPVHDAWTLGIDVVGEELGVDTRVSSELLLIERLDNVKRHLGRVTELLVAVYLERGEVVEVGWGFGSLLLLHACHSEGFALDGGKGLLALFAGGEFALCRSKLSVAIYRRQYPIWLGFELVYLLLSVNDKCQRGSLHSADAQHLSVLSILERIESGGVHTQQPVAHGSRESGQVERVVIFLLAQLGKAFAYGLVGHRRYPQSLDGAGGPCHLHHPPLYELTLLSGVTAVDDAVGLGHEFLDDCKLLLDALVFYELDAESWRNHG